MTLSDWSQCVCKHSLFSHMKVTATAGSEGPFGKSVWRGRCLAGRCGCRLYDPADLRGAGR